MTEVALVDAYVAARSAEAEAEQRKLSPNSTKPPRTTNAASAAG
jgi:hypothetical protein